MKRLTPFILIMAFTLTQSCTLGTSNHYHAHYTSLELAKSSENVLLICTDFQDKEAWDNLVRTVKQPTRPYGFVAYVDFVYDTNFANASIEDIVAQFHNFDNHTFVFVADKETFTHPENPVLVIDFIDMAHIRSMRAIPEALQGIENNLSIANMDFTEFADNADSDGIFRNFDE
jgi:hypothetical protein